MKRTVCRSKGEIEPAASRARAGRRGLEHVVPEYRGGSARFTELGQAEYVFGCGQERVVVVRHAADCPWSDERGEHDRTDQAAPWAVLTRLRSSGSGTLIAACGVDVRSCLGLVERDYQHSVVLERR